MRYHVTAWAAPGVELDERGTNDLAEAFCFRDAMVANALRDGRPARDIGAGVYDNDRDGRRVDEGDDDA